MWQHAMTTAYAAWELAIRPTGWQHGLLALGYLVCAWLCFISGHATRQNGENSQAWFIATGLMVILAIDTVLQPSLLLLQFLRSIAKLQGWYAERRQWQFDLLVLLGFASLLILSGLCTRIKEAWTTCGPTMLGVGLLVALAVLRAISFHYTDVVINQSIVGFSFGRLLELAGLVMIVTGTRRWPNLP